jgi:hypothetical protein
MKTLKFAMIAALIACTMVSLANTDGFTGKPKPIKVINLTLERAVQIPGLVWAMYTQLDKDDFLNGTPNHTYVAEVTYNGILYRISATGEQWMRFFRLLERLPISTEYPVIGIN